MADQRKRGKRLIGAQAPVELWDAVDVWLRNNPNKTVTDFVLSASLEKLKRSGIVISEAEVFRDGRARKPSVRYPDLAKTRQFLNES